jgi:hypothetical protein
MSANDPENDLQAEVFVLLPAGSEDVAEETAAAEGAGDGAVEQLQDAADPA